MRRLAPVLAALLFAAVALAPTLSMARAGYGSSFGSRGVYSYSAPPATRTAPYAAPLSRSMTPQAAPSYGYGNRGFGYGGYGYGRSPFVSGLMGGLIGAGIGGLLFGHGFFGGISGFGGLFGLLLQVFLLVMLFRWLARLFFQRQPAMAGSGTMFGRGMFGRGFGTPQAGGAGMAGPGGQGAAKLSIQPTDFTAFEQLLKLVQQAWSAHDLGTLQQITSPEMAGYFAEQLAQQTSSGVRNTVSDVRLEQGDLAQAWSEPGREYATVAMRFSMVDVTRDSAGRVVDGSATERVTATEVWTFLRTPGGRWILSAIQQTR